MKSTKLTTDNLGIPIYTATDIADLLLAGKDELLAEVLADPNDPEIQKFNQAATDAGISPLNLYSPLDVTQAEFDAICQNDWLMPDEYKQMDIEAWVIEQTPPWDPEHTRVTEELAAFKERNMLDLLKWMKYFVDTCRQNNILWGVGRGSSVASYVLYLIGVHKIDSIKYNLDWREFLR